MASPGVEDQLARPLRRIHRGREAEKAGAAGGPASSAPANSPLTTGPVGTHTGLYRWAGTARAVASRRDNAPGVALWRTRPKIWSRQPNRNPNQSRLRQRVVKVLPISAVPMVLAGSEGDGQVGVR
jgi:hypothetical protein